MSFVRRLLGRMASKAAKKTLLPQRGEASYRGETQPGARTSEPLPGVESDVGLEYKPLESAGDSCPPLRAEPHSEERYAQDSQPSPDRAVQDSAGLAGLARPLTEAEMPRQRATRQAAGLLVGYASDVGQL